MTTHCAKAMARSASLANLRGSRSLLTSSIMQASRSSWPCAAWPLASSCWSLFNEYDPRWVLFTKTLLHNRYTFFHEDNYTLGRSSRFTVIQSWIHANWWPYYTIVHRYLKSRSNFTYFLRAAAILMAFPDCLICITVHKNVLGNHIDGW